MRHWRSEFQPVARIGGRGVFTVFTEQFDGEHPVPGTLKARLLEVDVASAAGHAVIDKLFKRGPA